METLTALGAAALLVKIGLSLFATGLVRSKNSTSLLLRCIADLCFTSLAFWLIGSAFFWQTKNGWFGVRWHFLFGGSADPTALFFQTTAILTATTVVVAAAAERSRFMPMLWCSLLLGGLVLPIAGNWVWYGWLRRMGFVDVAGAAALELPAAICALVAVWRIGPRGGKYHKDGSSSLIPGHSLPLAAMGVMLALVGWIGFAAGSAVLRQEPAESAAAEVLFAAAAAGAAAIGFSHWRFGKIDLPLTLLGILSGLVAASAGAGAVGVRAAVLIGVGAGVLAPFAAVTLDLYLRIDDPVGLIATQAIGGAWGTLAAGVFAGNTPLERLRLLGVQALGLIVISIFALGVSYLLFAALKKWTQLRPREADEFDGLDLAEHDIGSYPDFQQNTIRSYHLREA